MLGAILLLLAAMGRASLWLLDGAQAHNYGWLYLLGMARTSRRIERLELDLCCGGSPDEPFRADWDAARAVATNRSMPGNPLAWMVWILVPEVQLGQGNDPY